MCEVLERAEKRGWQKGYQTGWLKGYQDGWLKGYQDSWQKGIPKLETQIILNLYRNNAPLELIASSVEKSIDEVRAILEKQTPLLS